MYFNSFIQDLKSIEGVASVAVADTYEVTIDVEYLDIMGFKDVLKPLLQNYFQYLRASEPVEVDSRME